MFCGKALRHTAGCSSDHKEFRSWRFLLLFLTGRISWLRTRGRVEYQGILILSVVGLAMYSLVHVGPRFIRCICRAFLGWDLRGNTTGQIEKVGDVLNGCMLACMALDVISSTAREVYRMTQEEGRDLHWEVATQLQRFGLREGDQVAFIGLSFGAYWARLLKVRIVAEIPSDETDSFCKADISDQVAGHGYI